MNSITRQLREEAKLYKKNGSKMFFTKKDYLPEERGYLGRKGNVWVSELLRCRPVQKRVGHMLGQV